MDIWRAAGEILLAPRPLTAPHDPPSTAALSGGRGGGLRPRSRAAAPIFSPRSPGIILRADRTLPVSGAFRVHGRWLGACTCSLMGAALGAYIDAMQQDGRLDADEAWLERQIAAKASSLKDGLERAKAAAKRLKQAFKAREKAASQHAPADALPPPPRVVVPDEVVQQYDEIEAAAAPLIKQYFRRAKAGKPADETLTCNRRCVSM